MPRKGLGVIYEPHDTRTDKYTAQSLIGVGSTPILGPMSEHAHVPPTGWQDQAWCQACCGFAIKQAVYIRQGVMGIQKSQRICPSEIDIYYRGRASAYGWENIVDIGANPVRCWEVIRKAGTPEGLGIVRYEDLPYDPYKVDDPPDPALYKRSIGVDWLEYRWVLTTDEQRCKDVASLLMAGHPVTAAITCDKQILSWRYEDGPWQFTGSPIGGHYILLTDVDYNGDFWGLGSWGSGYGFGGMHWIARSEIASPRTSYLATPIINRIAA